MIRLLNFAHGVVYWQNGILLADSGGKALVELQQVNALAKGTSKRETHERIDTNQSADFLLLL